MTTPSLTVEQAIGQLKPTEDFLRTWRKVGMIVGYRNLGRALSAIAPRKGAVKGIVEAQAADSESLEARLASMVIIHEGPLRLPSTPRKRSSWDYRPMTMARAVKMIPTIYTPAIVAAIRKWHVEHPYDPAKWPFCSSARRQPSERRLLDQSASRLSLYKRETCCGERMGIMESFDAKSAVYQCAVNPKHTKAATRKRDGLTDLGSTYEAEALAAS